MPIKSLRAQQARKLMGILVFVKPCLHQSCLTLIGICLALSQGAKTSILELIAIRLKDGDDSLLKKFIFVRDLTRYASNCQMEPTAAPKPILMTTRRTFAQPTIGPGSGMGPTKKQTVGWHYRKQFDGTMGNGATLLPKPQGKCSSMLKVGVFVSIRTNHKKKKVNLAFQSHGHTLSMKATWAGGGPQELV